MPVLRVMLCALTVCLTACNGEMTVDLAIVAPDGVAAVDVELKGAELLMADGTRVDLHYGDAVVVDLLDYTDSPYNIITGEELEEGEYTGIRLAFAEDGHALVDDEGNSADIEVTDTASFFDLDIDIREDETRDVTLLLDLRLSLHDDGDGRYTLAPVGHAVVDEEYAAISGRVDDDVVEQDCAGGDDVAVYLFDGLGVTPDDYDGSAPDPRVTAGVGYADASGAWRYAFDYVPEGGYTLALTCHAALENGSDDDALSFLLVDTVSVDAGDAATLAFSP